MAAFIYYRRFPGFRARVGVSRWDITPEPDAYAKNWGAARHWFATGVHRRLAGTAVAFAPLAGDGPPLVLMSLELGWWRSRNDADAVRNRVRDALKLPEENLIVHLIHTHAGPALDSDAPAEARPEAARAYLNRLADACVSGGRAALGDLQPATGLFRYGRCGLATQRDFVDPQSPDRFLCGFNPGAVVDDTLLVARVWSEDGDSLATLVNYACHPTTLAWENTLISPDYPGAMRALVEQETGGAPCLFLLGAAGELAPAEQYTGDARLADQHGRELGHAVLSTLAPLRLDGSHLRFEGAVESGAPLAIWRGCSQPTSDTLLARAPTLDVELKRDLPTIAEIDAALAQHPAGFQHERLLRQRRVRASVGDGPTSRERLWLWRLGDALLCGLPFEAYSILQTRLRQAFPDRPVLVLNVANGSLGYLPPQELYDHNMYTVWQTPFARGSLESVTAAAVRGLQDA